MFLDFIILCICDFLHMYTFYFIVFFFFHKGGFKWPLYFAFRFILHMWFFICKYSYKFFLFFSYVWHFLCFRYKNLTSFQRPLVLQLHAIFLKKIIVIYFLLERLRYQPRAKSKFNSPLCQMVSLPIVRPFLKNDVMTWLHVLLFVVLWKAMAFLRGLEE